MTEDAAPGSSRSQSPWLTVVVGVGGVLVLVSVCIAGWGYSALERGYGLFWPVLVPGLAGGIALFVAVVWMLWQARSALRPSAGQQPLLEFEGDPQQRLAAGGSADTEGLPGSGS